MWAALLPACMLQSVRNTMVLLWFYYVLLAFTALNHGAQDSQAPGQASGQPGGAPIPWPSRHPWRNPAAPAAQFGW